MKEIHLPYSDQVIAAHRFQYCPMCTAALKRSPVIDAIPRIHCPACGWIQLVSDCVCVISVVKAEGGVVLLYPPDGLGPGLPGGIVEYGEAPEEAAVREVLEETGLQVMIVQSLGWSYVAYPDFPGPTVYILFEAEAVGGSLKEGDEGPVCICPVEDVPVFSPQRHGSYTAWQRFSHP
ncbi:MAG: NUDIX domain-containing protein [Anaerolineae bacterium]|nr:NUDIX domain-containing protein [Anaerolineae bacterium]